VLWRRESPERRTEEEKERFDILAVPLMERR
jgi:hypothetical protein